MDELIMKPHPDRPSCWTGLDWSENVHPVEDGGVARVVRAAHLSGRPVVFPPERPAEVVIRPDPDRSFYWIVEHENLELKGIPDSQVGFLVRRSHQDGLQVRFLPIPAPG